MFQLDRTSDDEEDLESLRLAALQSLRAKPEVSVEPTRNVPFRGHKNFNHGQYGKGLNNYRHNYRDRPGGNIRNVSIYIYI